MSHLQTPFTQPPNAGHSDSADNLAPLFDFESPPSLSGIWSSASTSASPLSTPQSVHVVCNAPLFAPIPLPYHSPTFLQFELPDVDQDLSHPPYTQRTPKRKRVVHDDISDLIVPKRRSVTSSSYCHPLRRTTRCNPHHPITPITRPRLHCYT